jgi:hypothetical protein
VNWAAAAVVTVVLGMTTSAGADEPMVLSDFELDAITATGVLVDVNSLATALGAFTDTRTEANTFAFDGDHLDLGLGITFGRALACCGDDADVAVASTALGIGDHVRGTTRSGENNGRRWVHGFSAGFVLAVSFDKHFAMAMDERSSMLKELRAALADFHFELPDVARVGAR